MAVEACQFQMMLLAEQLARTKADAGHTTLESSFCASQLRLELCQTHAMLVRCTAQLRLTLRLQTQAICRDLVELCPTS